MIEQRRRPVLFRETLIGPRWLAATGASTLILLAVVTAISAPVVITRADAVGGWMIALLVAAFVLIVFAGVVGLTRRITISVSDLHLDVRLTPLRVMHIPLEEVDRAEVGDVTPGQAGGLGWRLAGSEQFALWSAGSAVRVALTGGRSRVLRTDRPEELRAAILSVRGKAQE